MSWLEEMVSTARERLPEVVFEYFRQGAGGELATREAEAAWARLRIRPRVLRDVREANTATSVLGTPVRSPILVGPSTLQRHADPRGELAMAEGALAAGSLVCVSSNSGTAFREIGQVGVPWWLQIYLLRDRGLTQELIQAGVAAGARALVLTGDNPLVGTKHGPGTGIWANTPKEFLLANLKRSAQDPSALDKADDLTPETISWLKEQSGLPVVVKGVLRADDALLCQQAGAAAVWVSNHGGRQLGRAVSTAQALPEVAGALSGSGAEVYVDSGLRSGEDALVALALGARAVFLGRPPLWGLASGGAAGVERVLTGISSELLEALTISGAGRCSELSPEWVS